MHSATSWFDKRTSSLVASNRDVTVINAQGALKLQLVSSVELAVELPVIDRVVERAGRLARRI
jgi:hypothetical protein